MNTETLFHLRWPLQLLMLAFALVGAWMMARRSD